MKLERSHKGLVIRPIQIVLLYVIISILWVLSSDFLLSLIVRNPQQIIHLQMVKGALFIILTALILFYLIRKYSQTISAQLVSLDKANKDLELFIYKASHDLRGPIASLIGLSNIAVKEIQDPHSLLFLKKIQDKSIKLDGLLKELVAFISLRDGNVEQDHFSLHEAVEDVMLRMSYMPDFEKITVKQSINHSQDFYGDARIMKSVLEKLVENAYRYSLPVEKPEMHINISQQKNHLLLEVADNGIGIPRQSLPQVFNMFYRASTLSNGNGLGLFIVRNLVEKLDGTVSILSEENKGTHVLVKIPVYPHENTFAEVSSYLQEA